MSHICALITLLSNEIDLVANSTPIVDLLSGLNSFFVKRISKLDLPTPESPIKTTVYIVGYIINNYIDKYCQYKNYKAQALLTFK